MKTSLAEETLDALACAGKSPADVDVVTVPIGWLHVNFPFLDR